MNDQELYPVLKDSETRSSTAASAAWTNPAIPLLTYSLLNTEDFNANGSSRHTLECSDFAVAIATSAFLRPQSGDSLPSVSLKTKKK